MMRKQLRLYNIYKSIVDGITDEIKGIRRFYIYDNLIHVDFYNGDSMAFSVADFKAKREAIRHINKKLRRL